MQHFRIILFSALAALVFPAHATSTVTTQARAIVTQAPAYPARAKAQGIEGLVVLQVLIDAQGKPSEVRPADADGHPALQNAAIDSVMNWRFAPALQNGQPVASTLQIPLRFELLAERKRDRRMPGPATLKALW